MTIVELVSGDGVIGVSETYGGEEPMKALEDLRDQIIGADPYRLTGLGRLWSKVVNTEAMRPRPTSFPEKTLDATSRTYAAVEVGCSDLIGKSVGVPVCDLIGGRVRDKVPFSAYPFYKHAGGGWRGRGRPTGQVRRAPQARHPRRASGENAGGGRIRMVKFKAGVLPPGGGD